MAFDPSFLDFCLSCDQHTVDGPYCSQSCRIADLEKSGSINTEYSSPSTPSFHKSISTSARPGSSPTTQSRLNLPPALDFPSQRTRASRPSTKHINTTPTSADTQTNLSRSSSLSSCNSTPTTAPTASSSTTSSPTSASSQPSSPSRPRSFMSESAKRELRHYESLFDQSRHRHRRSSLSYS